MIVLIAREPAPDAVYWTGRRWLAAVDAIAWPTGWIVLIRYLPAQTGVVGSLVAAVAVLCALNRLHRAIWLNHRYWFTTWRWLRVAMAMFIVGAVMKLMMRL